MVKTHLKITGADFRDSGQTEFEYRHQTKCGYVRDLVTRNLAEVTCKICLREENKQLALSVF